MSIVQPPANSLLDFEQDRFSNTLEFFQSVIDQVSDTIAPVWPLQDYVAVNPYFGISHLSFLEARSYLRSFSDCETLMPLEYYAATYRKNQFTVADIESAIEELSDSEYSPRLSGSQIAQRLARMEFFENAIDVPTPASNGTRTTHTIAEIATAKTGVDWTERIVDEISKHCASHYDRGQATWACNYKHLTLYQAWRSVTQHDCNIEVLGLRGFRKFVKSLSPMPEAAIVQLLNQMGVPSQQWASVLLCQAYSIPGWSAWTKYQTNWTDADGAACNDLIGLIAIRLAYDAALARSHSLSPDWDASDEKGYATFQSQAPRRDEDSTLRYVLLRASEIAYRNRLTKAFAGNANKATSSNERKLGQIVFCIDVRSERIRRQWESLACDIETFGFAGFFGMGFQYAELGQKSGNMQLPVLLKPQFTLKEGSSSDDMRIENSCIEKRKRIRTSQKAWERFQASAVGCFSFVETSGLLYGFKLLSRALGYSPKVRDDKLGPTLRGLTEQGISMARQADMAEGMLRNMGLIKNFAKLVVFCGHACQTENNPLAAGLDCGACGGHSGEPNARFAAQLLNQPEIRKLLSERGIEIPSDTHFLGALHNTTTDAIQFFEVDQVPMGLRSAFQELQSSCQAATKQTQIERLPVVGSDSQSALLKRASDWSEVRPEWGLAGNAAFIVAPRSLTKNAMLDARSFLHSYDYRQDAQGHVLETIMTAPMIVANWINMQYYASTVDNPHFGSGTKTVHNVVGGFGILSGNGGDLMTGLPWQSLHTGQALQHLPMRLQVVIAAPRTMIERVITKHSLVSHLLAGAWLHLVAIEDGVMYRYATQGNWEQLGRVDQATLPS